MDRALASRAQELYAAFPRVAPNLANLEVHVEVRTDGWHVESAAGRSLYRGTREDVLPAVATAINAAVLSRTRYLSVHAGVVGLAESAVVFPGRSGAGKSTLTAACLSQGMSYVSDEALCLSADLRVIPYPKPLTMSQDSLRLLNIDITGCVHAEYSTDGAKHLLAPVEAGAVGEPDSELSVRHVVIPIRGPRSTHLEPLPASAAVPELLQHSFNAFVDPRRAVRMAASIASNASCWRLHYDNACSAAALLSQALAPAGRQAS